MVIKHLGAIVPISLDLKVASRMCTSWNATLTSRRSARPGHMSTAGPSNCGTVVGKYPSCGPLTRLSAPARELHERPPFTASAMYRSPAGTGSRSTAIWRQVPLSSCFSPPQGHDTNEPRRFSGNLAIFNVRRTAEPIAPSQPEHCRYRDRFDLFGRCRHRSLEAGRLHPFIL